MQQTSNLYKDLLADPNHWKETRLAIGESGLLVENQGDRITFGGTRILVDSGGADSGFGETLLSSIVTEMRLFSEDTPAVGACVAGEIEVRMLKPSGDIPTQARLVPYVRLTNGVQHSEWIQKGVFYIDTRELDRTSDTLEWLTFHGYDDIVRAEEDYGNSNLDWPAKDIDVVEEIAQSMDVPIDPRTYAIMNRGYMVTYPGTDYAQREILGFIAASYAGCFVMSDVGALRLVQLNAIPPETRYLIVSKQDTRAITFGGDRILV